jgi:protein SCO1/2
VTRRVGIAAAVLALAVAGCVSRPPEPEVFGQVPPFELTADDGTTFSSSSLAGRSWLASFLFTSCPGPCPQLVEKLKTVRADVPVDHLEMVSISVDPVTDTPAVLTEYKKKHGIEPKDRWTFLTGPEDKVLELVKKGFLTGVQPSADPGSEGAVVHGVRVALIDGERRMRGFYFTESEEDLARLKRDVEAIRQADRRR